jgi:hypothetical protein
MSDHAAEYINQVVPDYKGNPLIEALPPIWSSSEVVDMLSYSEGQHDDERQLGAHHRFHCVLGLFQYYQPLREHVEIERHLSMCIRQGYLHRSPLSPEYAGSLAQGHEALKSRRDYTHLKPFRPTSAGFTIIGLSGVGKTSAVTNILSLYPQVIEHSSYRGSPLVLKQVVWLKLDCPHDGSVKGLCMGFFEAVDRAIGTNYFEANSKRGGASTIDVLMVRMAQAARLHCLGVLVIDEIQHLSLAKSGGSEKMLNFFVTLVNTIGIPVVLIGTSRAKPILQGDFRQARRSSGLGSIIWDRMKNDVSWDLFVLSMWENQWVKNLVPLTDELKGALYHESQGIVDIAVKLYAMVQIRAIALKRETFAAPDIHAAASECFWSVKPMLDALRSGDRKKIEAYGDIAPVDVEDYIMAYSAMLPPMDDMPRKREEISLSKKAVLMLLELGVAPPTAKRLVGKVMAEHLGLKKAADVVRLAYQQYMLVSGPDEGSAEPSQAGDLRNAEGYADMAAADMVETKEW